MFLKADFPWPPNELSPNARVHWATKAKHAKAYRRDCGILALGQFSMLTTPTRLSEHSKLHLCLTFDPPDNRKRDDDNLIAAFKAGRDGIAGALGVDDSAFMLHVMIGEKHPGGRVRVTITDSLDDHEWSWGDPWPEASK